MRTIRRCKNCGEYVKWTGTAWLHTDTNKYLCADGIHEGEVE